MYHALRELHTEEGKIVEPGFIPVSGFLPQDTGKLITFCAYPTSCLAFRREVAEQVLPILGDAEAASGRVYRTAGRAAGAR